MFRSVQPFKDRLLQFINAICLQFINAICLPFTNAICLPFTNAICLPFTNAICLPFTNAICLPFTNAICLPFTNAISLSFTNAICLPFRINAATYPPSGGCSPEPPHLPQQVPSIEVSSVLVFPLLFSNKCDISIFMPPPGVTGEVYCFPRRQLIFSFGRRVIYHLKGLWEYISKSIPSVCLYHDLPTNSWTSFLS